MARPSHSSIAEPAVSQVGISGSDDGGPAPDERTIDVALISRTLVLAAEDRTVSPLAFDRSLAPFAVSRLIKLPAL